MTEGKYNHVEWVVSNGKGPEHVAHEIKRLLWSALPPTMDVRVSAEGGEGKVVRLLVDLGAHEDGVVTHNFNQGTHGHAVTEYSATYNTLGGFGRGIRRDDIIIYLGNRYRIVDISYPGDPGDSWKAAIVPVD